MVTYKTRDIKNKTQMKQKQADYLVNFLKMQVEKRGGQSHFLKNLQNRNT